MNMNGNRRLSRGVTGHGGWARLMALSSAILLACLAVALTTQAPRPYDLLLRGGRIVDGTGSPWYRGDLAIAGDTIAAMAPRIEAQSSRSTPAGWSSLQGSSTSTRTPAAASSRCRPLTTTRAKA
jgi:hypothetical protein